MSKNCAFNWISFDKKQLLSMTTYPKMSNLCPRNFTFPFNIILLPYIFIIASKSRKISFMTKRGFVHPYLIIG